MKKEGCLVAVIFLSMVSLILWATSPKVFEGDVVSLETKIDTHFFRDDSTYYVVTMQVNDEEVRFRSESEGWATVEEGSCVVAGAHYRRYSRSEYYLYGERECKSR